MYSTLLFEEFRTDKNSKENNGIDVTRRYLNDSGNEYKKLAVGETVTVEIEVSGLEEGGAYVVIEDHLPAGLIPINPRFKSEQQNQKSYYYRYSYSAMEVLPDGMIMSLRNIGSGSNKYTYKARAVSKGIFATPPAVASLMYAPEVFGRSDSPAVEIGDTPEVIRKVSDPLDALAELGDTNIFMFGAIVIVLIFVIRLVLKRRGITLKDFKEKIVEFLKKKSPPQQNQPKDSDLLDSKD